jgi:uncharacterized protein (TIGR00255 family)
MIQSMTGFATTTLTITKGKDQKAHISIHLKTLNSRYFEVNAKLPHPLSHLETDLIKLFKKSLYRGYVHFTVHLDNPSLFKGSIEPALGTVQDYIAAIAKIKKDCKLSDPISLEMLVRLPNIFNIEEQGLDKQSAQAIMEATHTLISAVVKERQIEGEQLKKDIATRLSLMAKDIAAIAKRSQEHIAEQKEKLNMLLSELQSDESDLATARKNALYAVLDKIDIHEEIVRFESHLESMNALLENKDIEKGKRLDFTLQELAREINTITAKCSDALISKLAINIKVEIEKAREQVQNIV